MRKILFFLLVFPVLALSQVSSWRTNPPTQSQQTRVQPSIPQQQSNVSSWRNNPPLQSQPQLNSRGRDGVQNWYEPNRFGYYWGNYGWYQPYPYIWYDNYGLRQRSIVYIYENGKRDTIVKQPVYLTAGIGYTSNKQTSFSGAIGGKKGYFIVDYTMTTAIDQNQYFPYGNLTTVDFPISKENFKKESTLYLGVGKRFNKLGIHGMIGFGNDNKIYRGQDKVGYLTFPNKESFTTVKFGLLRNYKNLGLKLDYDPIKEIFTWGLGIHL